jgi:hypothetical protein
MTADRETENYHAFIRRQSDRHEHALSAHGVRFDGGMA